MLASVAIESNVVVARESLSDGSLLLIDEQDGGRWMRGDENMGGRLGVAGGEREGGCVFS